MNQTLGIGRKIARKLQAGDIICLFGQLGSGKTVLTKGIASGLGIKKSEVISPSFVLIRQYTKAKIPLYHFDLYRLKQPKDILCLGYEEYLYDEGITVIEWADRLEGFLPVEYLKIEINIKEKNRRVFQLEGFGKYYKGLVSKVKELL